MQVEAFSSSFLTLPTQPAGYPSGLLGYLPATAYACYALRILAGACPALLYLGKKFVYYFLFKLALSGVWIAILLPQSGIVGGI